MTRIPALSTNRLAPARAAAGLLLAAIVVACGTTAPTAAPSGSLAATSVASSMAPTTASPSPATSLASIVPVPTSQLVAPAPPAAHLDDATAAALQKALGSIRTSGAYPGISAAVVFPDGSLWAGQSGSAVLSPQAPVTVGTLFSVGSISKTFVAALTGRLAARGTISLDDPLAKYVPTFHDATSITLRQLLNHTSGVQDIFEIKGFSDAILANRTRAWTAEEVLAKVGSARYTFAPGKGYRYSNTDYILLGAAIEQATGEPIAALVRSEFLEPLGLSHTFLQTEEEAPGAKAHGYFKPASAPVDQSAGTMLPFTAEATVVGPAGAYVSTATDLARWGDALYNGNVLDQATLAAMTDISQTQGFKAPFTPHWVYGLGLEETTIAGQTAWGHRGYLDGFWSAMWYLPASRVTIVVIANAEWADPVAAAAVLAKVILA
ncbi:MAG TPA: serine hydrolase [Candidatus Limnocylindrales bacterium]